MREMKAPFRYKVALTLAVLLAIGGWVISKDARVGWAGVPPVPSKTGLLATSMGDSELAYRFSALPLQNLGEAEGRGVPLTEYNYSRLQDWFFRLYELSPRSNFVPMIAAYYFGATRDPQDALKVATFLEVAGNDPYREKWRWLVQAVYLARFRAEDLDRAEELAEKLASLKVNNPDKDMPMWTQQMPAFIKEAKGDEESAVTLMKAILTTTEDLHPAEINFMVDYIEKHDKSATTTAPKPAE